MLYIYTLLYTYSLHYGVSKLKLSNIYLRQCCYLSKILILYFFYVIHFVYLKYKCKYGVIQLPIKTMFTKI